MVKKLFAIRVDQNIYKYDLVVGSRSRWYLNVEIFIVWSINSVAQSRLQESEVRSKTHYRTVKWIEHRCLLHLKIIPTKAFDWRGFHLFTTATIEGRGTLPQKSSSNLRSKAFMSSRNKIWSVFPCSQRRTSSTTQRLYCWSSENNRRRKQYWHLHRSGYWRSAAFG